MYKFICLTILAGFLPSLSSAECVVEFPDFVGDGYCDNGAYNTPQCNWDGGDCCEATCVSKDYQCGYTAFNCTNPGVNSAAPTPIPPTRSPTFEGCDVADPSLIGDGYCDRTGGYNTEACLWDGGDCCESTCAAGRPNPCGIAGYSCHLDTRAPSALPTLSPTTLCRASDLSLVGDGFCDGGPEYNNALCDWDGGDCCSQTCTSTPNPCGTNGFFCLQPEFSNAPTYFPTPRPTTATPTAAPTASPSTATPTSAAPTTSTPTTQRPTRTPSTATPTAPCVTNCPGRQIESITFSSDGTELYFVFDGETDQASGVIADYAFSCSLIAIFDGDEQSTCYWVSSTTFAARLSSSSVSVGDPVALMGGVVRRKCTADIDCASRQYAPQSSSTVSAPSDPDTPVAALRALASVVNECDAIRLDASASSGQGTANWAAVAWEVSGPGVTDENAILAELTAYGTSISSTILISNAGFSLGLVSIKIVLTNFIGGQSETSVDVEITDLLVPGVSVLGSNDRSFFINEEVRLRSYSFIPACLADRMTALTYTWSVFDADKNLLAIQSSSNTPSRFKTPAFAFESGTYFVVVSSTPDNGLPATYEVVLHMVSQGAVAVISGATAVTKSTLVNFDIDASNSYHASYPDSAELFYSWSCVLESGGDCGLGNLPTSDVLTFNSGDIATSTDSYVFTVSVTSDKDAISSTATIAVTVVDFALPDVHLDETVAKYNPQAPINIGAVLGPLGNATELSAQWAVSPVVSAGATSSDLVLSLDGAIPTFQNFPISFLANKLSAGVTYTLRLSASFSGSQPTTAATSVSIRINRPPYNGQLQVYPSSGTSLSTPYVLANKLWIVESDSLPVVYILSASVGDGTAAVDLGRGESSYTTTVLPPGLDSSGNVVTCSAVVRDAYDSLSNVVTATTVVLPGGDPSAVASIVDSLISSAEATQNFDLLEQILGAGASNLNYADCTSAPDCDALNRHPCSTTPGTCGECLINYIGIDGASNEQCELVNSRRLQDSAACTIETTTVYNTSCHKKCPNDCSGSGSCVAYGFNDNELDFCAAGDLDCHVECKCGAGSYGRSCDLTEAEYLAALKTRDTICFSFYKSLSFQDVSSEVVSSRLVLTSLILLDSSQISEYALTNCTRVATETVESYPEIAAAEDILPLVVDALSNALNSKDVMSADLLNSTYAAIDVLMLSSQQISSPGSNIEVITQNIRLSSSVQTAEGINGGGTVLTVPRTLFEVGFNTPAAYVTLSDNDLVDSDPDTFGLSIVQYTNNPSGTVSNSTLVNVQASYNVSTPSEESKPLNFTVVLQNTVPFVYSSEEGTEVILRCDETKDSTPYTVSANCSGVFYDAECPGNVTAELSYVCPVVNEFPVCNNYDSDGKLSEDTICALVSFTESSTTCLCSLSLNSLTIGTKASAANVGSGFLVVADNFLYTWSTLTVLTADDILKNAVIFSITVGLICALILGLIFFAYWDVENIAEKHRAQKEVALSVNAFFKKVIPKQFEESAWPIRFLKVLSKRHSWFCFLFSLAEDDYRTCQWNILIGKLINYVFVGTLLTVFFFGDDGTCERQHNKSDCLALKGVDFQTSVCGWNDQYEYCEYVAPPETFMTLILLALAINVLCVPLDVVVLWGTAHYKALLTHYSEARIEQMREEDRLALAADPEANKNGSTVSAMHELKSYPSRKATMIRAARLSKMQQQIDNLEVNAEVAILVSVEDKTVGSDQNSALNLLADYVTPTKRDMKSVVTRKAAVGRHLLRQNVTGKNAFDGRGSILKTKGKGASTRQFSQSQFSQSHLEIGDSDVDLRGSMAASENDINGEISASKLEDVGYQQLLRRNVKIARARASKIKRRMSLLGTDERKEIYLVRKFLVDNMIGVRRLVANRFFFGSFNDEFAYAKKSLTFLKVVCLLFPIYLAIICLYIFLYGVTLGSGSTNLWLISIGISYLQDIVLLETCSIYMVNVVLVSIVYKDLKLLSNRLRKRAKAILNRVDGQMSLAKCYLQHLNAACRAARGFPQLGMSRLLISLNDFDMPKAFVPRYHKPQSKWYFLVAALLTVKNFFVLMYLSLPDSFQDAIIETLVCCGLNFFFIVIYLGTVVSGDDAAIAGIFVFFIVMAIILLPWTKAVRQYLWNLVFPQREVDGKYEAEEEDGSEDEFENEVFKDLEESEDLYLEDEEGGEDEEYDFELELSEDSPKL